MLTRMRCKHLNSTCSDLRVGSAYVVNETERVCEVACAIDVLIEVDDIGDVGIECDNPNTNSSGVDVETSDHLFREVDD